jgi:Papain-like cysteine protease AvrRpt2
VEAGFRFTMQAQEQDQWCWAAGSVSVARHYGPTAWTQCSLANHEFGETTCCENGATAVCDKPWYPNRSLQTVGCFGGYRAGAMNIASIVAELSASRPIGVGIAWRGEGRHFAVITAVDDRTRTLRVDDPWYGRSEIDYDMLRTAYRTIGTWTGVYLTQTVAAPPGGFVTSPQSRPGRLFRYASFSPLVIGKMADPALPVYTASLTAAAEGRSLEAAEPTGENRLAEGFVAQRASHGERAVHYGAVAEKEARELRTVLQHSVNVRILELPALYVTAAWIVERSEIVPIGRVPTFLRGRAAYTVPEFERLVQLAAKRRLQFTKDEQAEERRLRRADR